jgi:bifunctional DNA-binding transcriptional regulator/antitoxin component of YhaV-PrlF toxin-antitoxin module
LSDRPDSEAGIHSSDSMNNTARIQPKGQVTIPMGVRRMAGLSRGDVVNFAFSRGRIVITPKLAVDRPQFPAADDESTPEQRRAIDSRLREAERGPFYGPFKDGDGIAAFLKGRARAAKPARTRKPR